MGKRSRAWVPNRYPSPMPCSEAGSWSVAHCDPFDRVLAAQAHLEDIPLVSADVALDLFGINRRC
ncbi:MAG: hypothetical protein ACYDCX_02535 [Acidithiobacillus sp.]